MGFSKKNVQALDVDHRGTVITENLGKILEDSRERKILFVVATQQAKSNSLERKKIKGVRYSDEVGFVRDKLNRGHEITQSELYFLVHDSIMRDVVAWSAREDVLLADVRRELDERRDTLLSWVHLNPEGNRIIASALSEIIYDNLCE